MVKCTEKKNPQYNMPRAASTTGFRSERKKEGVVIAGVGGWSSKVETEAAEAAEAGAGRLKTVLLLEKNNRALRASGKQ